MGEGVALLGRLLPIFNLHIDLPPFSCSFYLLDMFAFKWLLICN